MNSENEAEGTLFVRSLVFDSIFNRLILKRFSSTIKHVGSIIFETYHFLSHF